MADRIELGRGQFVFENKFEISGKEELVKFIETLNSMTRKNNFAAYWKSQEELIRGVTKACEDFNKTQSNTDAKNLINSFNALKATADKDMDSLFSDYERIVSSFENAAKQMGTAVIGELSPANFRKAFESFEMLEAHGLEATEIFKRISSSADVDHLRKQVEDLTESLARTTRTLESVKRERDNLLNGAEMDRLLSIEEQYNDLIHRMKGEFSSFLQANDLDPNEVWGRFSRYFDQISNGSMTAKEAITAVRDEYAALIQYGEAGSTAFSSGQMQEFISKLENACTMIEQMRGEIQALTEGAALRQMTEEMAASEAITERQREAISSLVAEGSGLSSVAQLLVELIKNFDATEHETNEAATAVKGLLDTLKAIGDYGNERLGNLSKVFKNLRYATQLNVDEKQYSNLVRSLKDIGDIPNLSSLQALTNISLSGFSDMHVSKASLSNLATYLPEIAKVNVDRLKELSAVNLSNFNNLSVKKATTDNLERLFNALAGKQDATATAETAAVGKEKAALGDVNELYKAHKAAVEAAVAAEKAKAEVSGEVSTALKQESTAANEASVAADKDAAAAKRHSDAQRSVIDTLKNVQSAIHTLENTSGGKDQPLYKDLQGLEAMLTKLNETSGRMSAEQILRELSELKLRQSEATQSMNLFVLGVQDLERAEREAANTAASAEKEQAKLDAALQKSVDNVEKLGQEFEGVKARVEKIDTSRITEGFSAAYDRLRSTLNVLQSADTSPQDKLNAYKEWAVAIGTVNAYLKNMERAEREAARATRESTKEDEARVAAQTRLQSLLNSVNSAGSKAQTSGLETDANAYRKLAQEIQNVIAADGKLVWTSEDLRRIYALLNQEYVKLHGSADEHVRDAQRTADAIKSEEDATRALARAGRELEDLKAKVGNLGLEENKQKMAELVSEAENLKTALETGGPENWSKNYKAFLDKLAEATHTVKQLSDEEKKADQERRKHSSTYEQINKLLQKSSDLELKYAHASGQDRDAIRNVTAELKTLREGFANGTVSQDQAAQSLERLKQTLSGVETNLRTSGTALQRWWTNGLTQLSSQLSYTFGMAAIVTKTVAEVRKMISTAVELDTAMNNLQIVTRGSNDDMAAYGKTVSQMAKETAQSTKDLIDATTVYARLGYTMDESATLSKYTAMLQGVGDIEASAAQDAMTAIIKAFHKDVDDVESVMDKLVTVGNNFPISVSQLAEGMNNAGSMLESSGNSLEQSIALLTSANTTVNMCRAA